MGAVCARRFQQRQAFVHARLPVGGLPRQVLADGLGEFPSAQGRKVLPRPTHQIKIRLHEQAVPNPKRRVPARRRGPPPRRCATSPPRFCQPCPHGSAPLPNERPRGLSGPIDPPGGATWEADARPGCSRWRTCRGLPSPRRPAPVRRDLGAQGARGRTAPAPASNPDSSPCGSPPAPECYWRDSMSADAGGMAPCHRRTWWRRAAGAALADGGRVGASVGSRRAGRPSGPLPLPPEPLVPEARLPGSAVASRHPLLPRAMPLRSVTHGPARIRKTLTIRHRVQGVRRVLGYVALYS